MRGSINANNANFPQIRINKSPQNISFSPIRINKSTN